MSGWNRVRKGSPCPVCRRPDHCTISADGAVVRCTRMESPKQSVGRDGVMAWLHFLDGEARPTRRVDRKPVEVRPEIDWQTMAEDMYHHPRSQWMRCKIAAVLGVTDESLEPLLVGRGEDHDEFASFPTRDAAGRVTGITRRYLDASKKTMQWSSAGLFYPLDWEQRRLGPVFLPEGASDVAALISIGLCGVGRFNNTSAVFLAELLRNTQRSIVVLCERDEKPHRRTGRNGNPPGCDPACRCCNNCYPGLFGGLRVAEELSAALGRGVFCKFVPDGAKDVRSWLNTHNNPNEFLTGVWKEENEAVY